MQKVVFVHAITFTGLEKNVNEKIEELEKTSYINSVIFLGEIKTEGTMYRDEVLEDKTIRRMVEDGGLTVMINYSTISHEAMDSLPKFGGSGLASE